MLRKDYLLAQIEELAKFMAKLLSTLSGLTYDDAVQTLETALAERGLVLADLIEIPEAELIDFLKQNPAFDSGNIEALAKVFEVMGEKSANAKWYAKSLFLLEYINQSERIFSLERNLKIDRLKSLL